MSTISSSEDDYSSSEPTGSGKSAYESMILDMLSSSAESLSDGVATVGIRHCFNFVFGLSPPVKRSGAPDCTHLKTSFDGLQKTRVPKGFLGLQCLAFGTRRSSLQTEETFRHASLL